MTQLDVTTKQSFQQAIYAYLQTVEGASWEEVRAIAGALLAVKTKAGELNPQGLEIETWVEQLVADVDPTQMAASGAHEAARLLANQAKHWQTTLAVKAQATLDAYIQKFAPDLETQSLEALVATVLPIVADTTLAHDTARRLMAIVSRQVDAPTAQERAIDPKWLMAADKVQQVWQYRDVEAATTAVVNSYVHKFQPTAIEIGTDLITQAVQAVTNSQIKLGLDVDLDPATRQLLVQQVMLKVNLREPSPPTKTSLEIAQQLHDEVQRYRREQGLDGPPYLPAVTTTDDASGSSSLGGEMSVGIELKPGTAETDSSAETPASSG